MKRELLAREWRYARTFWNEVRAERDALVSLSMALITFIVAEVPSVAAYAVPLRFVSGFALLLACYLVWRRGHIKTEPKLNIIDQVRRDNMDYEIGIENVSTTALDHPGIDLVRSEPPLPAIRLTIEGIPLDINRRSGVSASLNPGRKEWFILVRRNYGTNIWQLKTPSGNIDHSIQQQSYCILLRAHAANAPPEDRWFVMEPEGDNLTFSPSQPPQPSR